MMMGSYACLSICQSVCLSLDNNSYFRKYSCLLWQEGGSTWCCNEPTMPYAQVGSKMKAGMFDQLIHGMSDEWVMRLNGNEIRPIWKYESIVSCPCEDYAGLKMKTCGSLCIFLEGSRCKFEPKWCKLLKMLKMWRVSHDNWPVQG